MAYRYTNTDKWGDAWFTKLKPIEKLLFNYLCDNCDIAGFIELNTKRWASDIGTNTKITEGALKGLSRGLIYSDTNDCIYILNYLKHQKNLPLDPLKNPAHKGIVKRFELYSFKFSITDINKFIEGAYKGLHRPLGNGKGNGISNGKGKKAEFDFSFVDEKFKIIFDIWIKYKRAKNQMYKTQESIEACYRNLLKLSMSDINKAQIILDNSMGNNYTGLFVPKEGFKNSGMSMSEEDKAIVEKYKVTYK